MEFCEFQESMSLSSMLPEELECFKALMVHENEDSNSEWEPEEGEESSAFDVFDLNF